MSRRVSQSFTLIFAELKFILPILCGTLRFISEPLREKNTSYSPPRVGLFEQNPYLQNL
jgi:hypothetical protein